MTESRSIEPLLRRPVPVSRLPAEGVEKTIRATAGECEAVANAFGLVALRSLAATLTLKPVRDAVSVRGRAEADLTQTCVVSLDPFDSVIAADIDVVFMTSTALASWLAAHGPGVRDEASLDDEDQPDEIVDGVIDIGAVTTEFLALNLDPYPRKPGVAFEPPVPAGEPDPSPFAALAGWKSPKPD